MTGAAGDILEALRDAHDGAGRHAPGHGLVVLAPNEEIGRTISVQGAPILTHEPGAEHDGTRTVARLLGLGATVTLLPDHLPETLVFPAGVRIALHPDCDPEAPEIRAAVERLEELRRDAPQPARVWICSDRDHYHRAVTAGIIPDDVPVYGSNQGLRDAIAHRRDGGDAAIIDDTDLMAAYATPSWSPCGARLFAVGPLREMTREMVSDDTNGVEQINLDGPEDPSP